MLTDCEYKEIKAREACLQGDINGADRDKNRYDDMKKAAQDRKECAEGALSLYTNHLHDAVVEYEAAHPPEEN